MIAMVLKILETDCTTTKQQFFLTSQYKWNDFSASRFILFVACKIVCIVVYFARLIVGSGGVLGRGQ